MMDSEIKRIDSLLFKESVARKEVELQKDLLTEQYSTFFEEMNRLEEAKKKIEEKIDALKISLLSIYGDHGEPPLGVHHSVVNHLSYKVEDERAVPREYCSPDRGKIFQDIKNGIKIPGITLLKTRVIRIK
jgi:hypothetical protein